MNHETAMERLFEARQRISELEEENKRLREALRWIAAQENLTFAECSVAEEIVCRARAALSQEEKPCAS